MVYRYVPGTNHIKFTYKDEKESAFAQHMVLWSGGCDSTILLYELLDVYGKDNVIAISYNYPWLVTEKQQSEMKYREAVKAKLKLLGNKFDGFTHINFDIKQEWSGCGLPHVGGGLPQAISWLFSVPIYTPNNSYVYDGAIRNDDLTLYCHEYEEIFTNVSKILNRNISLRRPYLYLNKSQIIEKLFEYGLYDETWYCENPKDVGRKCFQCVPCQTHLSALIDITMTTKDEIIKCLAQKEIDKILSDKTKYGDTEFIKADKEDKRDFQIEDN